MRKNTVRVTAAVLLSAGITVGATACSNKYTEPFNDAPRSGADNSGAIVISQPDGFGNAAAKCLGPDLIVTLYHNDKAYGSVAISKDDQNCRGHAPVKLP